jgi:hypothetical protein
VTVPGPNPLDIPAEPASPARAGALLRGTLHEVGAVRFRVRGGCMSPALREGDEVLVVAAERVRPGFGDVVLLEGREGIRLHRLVWTGGTGELRTKGDRAPGFDGPVQPEAALGTVAGVLRPAGLVPVRSRIRAIVSLCHGLATRAHRGFRASWAPRPLEP